MSDQAKKLTQKATLSLKEQNKLKLQAQRKAKQSTETKVDVPLTSALSRTSINSGSPIPQEDKVVIDHNIFEANQKYHPKKKGATGQLHFSSVQKF